ncbi:MAG: tRNA-(ms[2]io[6]A)-hydroxylase [Flavobacteriaceae bacterium]|jgi:tRNA-(ms[2]io[6]A)-hydroxylase|nr:tRNA-(ms[2]io[6]A)-hydroxylase [Flavobacteriaceae bacterium]
MLGLKLPTDPRWANIAEKNIEEILIDHAWCEQKAASTAISIIVTNPDKTELINEMSDLVREEMGHFKMVMDKLEQYGYTLGPQRPDEYVKKLSNFFPKGGSRTDGLVHALLVAALIEARSCERFRLLSENLKDPELAQFYYNLMKSEAGHYTMFLSFARKYDDVEKVNKKWQSLLEFEAQVMKDLGKHESIHG